MQFNSKILCEATAVLAGAIAVYYFPISQPASLDSTIGRVAQENLKAPDIAEILGMPFIFSYLKNDSSVKAITQNLVGNILKENYQEMHGMVRKLDVCLVGSCMSYVSSKIGIQVDLKPITLVEKGYEIVSTPKTGDVVLYFKSEDGLSNPMFNHIGIISKVEDGEVWVQSKWGFLPCLEHLEEIVPKLYGNAVSYLRKIG